MVTILASIHSAKTKSKVLVRPGKSCLGRSFSWDTVIHNTTPPGSGCSTSDSAFPGRKPRKVGIFSQARKSFSSFTQDLSAETGAGSSFQQMMQLLQHQGWPFIQNSCSLSTAQMATLVTKQDRFIKKSPIFPTAQVHFGVNPHCTLQPQGPYPALEQALPESSPQEQPVLAPTAAVVGAVRGQPAAP